jgi:hypothetical protein
MWLELARRLSLILLIVAVATGLGVPVVHAGPQHDRTTVAMSADAGCVHDGCPIDQNAAAHTNCFATCAGVSLLSSTPTGIAYFAVGRDVLQPSHDVAMLARNIPPDPHPPKQA